MCDECDFEGLDDEEIPEGTKWPATGAAPLHWTDAPLIVLSIVAAVGDFITTAAGRAGQVFQAHANHVGRRRVMQSEMVRDIEAITGEHPGR